ncbi:VOC family protein [Nakamurella flavida]|uniref:VOC family protein n=1 Tax=Nakamurella flavida TaxID=363630 RepID=A0A938YM44_9ACTN|nr:VOC family protein [Nakamurella flavida]MBM9475435.1 VOC family protein [Nakamurella flavida]MBM9475477.1 VOC family protein [Nakamurella flavida]MDP9777015.1 hypothetical protein [Nakamurella flavida]
MSRHLQVVFDAAGPAALAEFWKLALGYVSDPPPGGFASWDQALAAWGVPAENRDDANAIVDPDGAGPRVFFQKVPEAKAGKNRLHLDVSATPTRGTDAEMWPEIERLVAELVGHGATVVEERRNAFGDHWMVMTDPEGNEFCVH